MNKYSMRMAVVVFSLLRILLDCDRSLYSFSYILSRYKSGMFWRVCLGSPY